MHKYEVLRKPLITEKSTALQALGKYAFRVSKNATKEQVKEAVEKAFNVTVIGLNVMNVRGKEKRMGRHIVAPKPWKKAVVTLKPGDKIELFEATS